MTGRILFKESWLKEKKKRRAARAKRAARKKRRTPRRQNPESDSLFAQFVEAFCELVGEVAKADLPAGRQARATPRRKK